MRLKARLLFHAETLPASRMGRKGGVVETAEERWVRGVHGLLVCGQAAGLVCALYLYLIP